jgi:hypothetical protein
MQAKLILIAATATVVIAAIVASFAVIFGAEASGNFKITGRQYFNGTSSLGYEEISASHLNGNIKFTYLRQSSKENDRFLLQVVDDMAYEVGRSMCAFCLPTHRSPWSTPNSPLPSPSLSLYI